MTKTRPPRKRRRYPKVITAKHPRRRDVAKAAASERPAAVPPADVPDTVSVEHARELALTELKIQIFALRRQGASYQRIATQLKCSTNFAHKVVQEATDELNADLALTREQWRALELERIDALLVRLEGWLREGREVKESPDGRTTIVTLQRPTAGYIFAYLRALERRAKLLGLDAPTRVELSEHGDERDLSDDELARRADELRREVEADEARARFRVVGSRDASVPTRAKPE
jgi:hypothetical protein